MQSESGMGGGGAVLERDGVEPWRRRILDVGSAAIGVLGGLTFLVVARRPVWLDAPMPMVVAVLGLCLIAVAAAWRGGPYRSRAVALVAVQLAAQLVFLFRVGFTAAPALAGLTAVVGAGLLLGVRWALGVWLVSTLLLIVGSQLIRLEIVPSAFDASLLDPTSADFGLRYGLTFATFGALLAVGISVVVEQLSRSLREARVAHEAEQRSQAQWRSLVDNAPDLILIVDREHRIAFRNRGLLGFREEEVIGSAVESFIPEADREPVSALIDRVFESAESSEYELQTVDAEGRRVWLNARLSPVMKEGRVHRVTVLATNITEHRTLEEQLRHAQKMEALGQLAGGVAHDFNNLLTVILGYSEELLARLKESPELVEDLSSIQSAAVRGAGLTRQLLAFSRQQPARASTISLNAVVRETETMLGRLLGESFELETELAPELGWARADRGQLEQVLTNLVVNARDAMPEGGTIRVTTRNVAVGPEEARSAGIAPGDYVSLAVADPGVGMPEQVRQRIFDPFFTTKEAGKGTGLGLSTIYGIVQGAGGEIRVESRTGAGSCFEVLLPRTGAEARQEDAPQEPARRTSRVFTVLVVEDEAPVRRLLVGALESAGYSVLEAADGDEALAIVSAHDGDIHAMLSDVRLPGMSGPELARELLRRRSAIQVVFMTGYPGEADASGLDAEIIPKPFSPHELVRHLQGFLEREAGSDAARAPGPAGRPPSG